jgi:high affinity Mn2+ porin
LKAATIEPRLNRGGAVSGTWCRIVLFPLALATLSNSAAAGTASAEEPGATPPQIVESQGDSDTVSADTERYAFHAQATVVEQGVAGFPSPYRGENSLDPAPRGRETMNATLFAGASPWKGAEIWIDPEVGQGAALSDSRGVASYLNAEAPRGGSSGPYFRLQRVFLTQTLDLGGKSEVVEGDQNVLAGSHDENRIVLTLGKLSVADIFDLNDYSHDSQEDFLNASLLIAGSFDFAGDYSGYTYGTAAELYEGPWTLRLGVFDLTSTSQNGQLDGTFGQFQWVVEGERRFSLGGKPGSFKITAFDSRARLGDYAAAVRRGLLYGVTPDVNDVQSYRSRAGVSFNIQQQVGADLGLFARLGWANGQVQSFDFADIDRTLSVGAVLSGNRWGRDDDAVGLAGAVNAISPAFVSYLDHGGLGLAIGDGKLPHSGSENVLESFYRWAVSDNVRLTLDYQLIVDPAYNRDRGPVSAFAVRFHVAI